MDGRHRRTVVIIVTAFDVYQGPLLDGVREVLCERGFFVVAHADDSMDPETPAALISLLRHPTTCGVIATSTKSAQRDLVLDRVVRDLDLPMICIGHERVGCCSVRADNRQGMAALMRLLLDDCQIRSPVLVQGLAHQPDHVVREQVFRTELAKRGLGADEGLIFRSQSVTEIVKRKLQRLLELRRDLDAVVTMDDHSALVAMEVLGEHGLRVPQDVVVTGFDNYPLSSIHWPTLTTVDQSLELQGQTAARMLLDALRGRRFVEQIYVECKVIPRDSTAVGDARRGVVAQTVESVTWSARIHLTTQAELLRLDRALMRCRTLEDICEAFAVSLPSLGILRAFIVIYEQEPHCSGLNGEYRKARLVLDYRDGAAHPLPDTTFSARELLPSYLAAELNGLLGFQALSGVEDPLGYLLFEQTQGPVSVAESLAMDLSRTMDVVFRTHALREHSASLERLVDLRTKELRAEVAMRSQAEQELRKANDELQRTVVIDGLTGIANRTALDQHLERHWKRHVAQGRKLAILMVDVDLFKLYNDCYGHLCGDQALKTVASCLSRASRYPYDLACRFGGEEFMVVLPFSDERDAVTVANRFTNLLAEAAIPHEASNVSTVVTASIGIAVVVPDPSTRPAEVMAAADRALYTAKREGRNRTVVLSPTVPSSTVPSSTVPLSTVLGGNLELGPASEQVTVAHGVRPSGSGGQGTTDEHQAHCEVVRGEEDSAGEE